MQWDCMPSSKCEPLHLRPFINFYNSTFCTNYVLKECLDVRDRLNKRPEALFIDKDCKKRNLVIERKAIVWPKDSQKYHRAFHEHCDWFLDRVRLHFQNACYMLLLTRTIQGSKIARQRYIEEIARMVIQNKESIKKGSAISGTIPVKWKFGMVNPTDWDM